MVIERSRNFPAWVGVVDDRYSARVSSSDCSRKAIVCQLELLNGGFRFHVVNTRNPDDFHLRFGLWGLTMTFDTIHYVGSLLLAFEYLIRTRKPN